MGVVVTIYSSYGGLTAVVWADAFQMIFMTSGALLVTIMAVIYAGGLQTAWEIATEEGRTAALDIDVSPVTRHTVWNVLLMTGINWRSHYCMSQANYKRVSAVPTIQHAKRILYYNIIGMSVFLMLVLMMGVFIFVIYNGCDPITQGHIRSPDQIAVYFVNHKLNHRKVIPGIFVATLLCAAFRKVHVSHDHSIDQFRVSHQTAVAVLLVSLVFVYPRINSQSYLRTRSDKRSLPARIEHMTFRHQVNHTKRSMPPN